jgi:HlyD family type I secretion membrane fusion protein
MTTLGGDLYGLAAARDRYARPARPAMIGLLITGAFIAAMTLWGTLAPVAGAAIATGNLQVQSRRQSVQHPYGGVVQRLLVHEGEHVAKGQLLMTLDDSDPRSKLDVLLADEDAALATEARLIAERDGADAPRFPDALRSRAQEPAVRQAMANETAIMAARKHQFQAETAVLQRKIDQLKEQIAGTQAQIDGSAKQKELLQEELDGVQKLYSQGYAPKTRILSMQRDEAKLQADIGAQQASIAGMKQQIAQTELEIAKAERTRVSDITDQLRAAESKLAELRPKIDAARDVVARTRIVAPVEGAVVGLDVFTEGGVIQPGAKLMDIVPSDNPLIVEGKLKLSDVNEVAPGKAADVRLTGINYIERPRLRGTVETVSADRITSDKSGESYYAIQVALNRDDVKNAHVDLQSGMPAEVIVPTRPRTLFEYLIGPLRDEITGAFRER